MSYRPPSHQPKGAWARHLHEQRKARDLSAVAAFELVYERIGWSPKSRTAYIAIDMGDRKPKPNEAAVLAEEFGWPPDPVDLPETPDLASALMALARELEEGRKERARMAARLEEMDAVLRALVAPAIEGEGGPVSGGLR